jgi:hypothetical protein
MSDKSLSLLERTPRPERVMFVLELLTNDVQAETRTMQLVRAVVAKYGVSETCAIGDVKQARIKLAEAMNEAAPWLGASVKDTLLRLARKAETAGEYATATDATFKLGKFLGLHEKADATVAATLSPEELQAQLDAAIAAKLEAMAPDEIAALLARKGDS